MRAADDLHEAVGGSEGDQPSGLLAEGREGRKKKGVIKKSSLKVMHTYILV